MYGALDISTSGMVVQRTRLDVASANIAAGTANEVRDAQGRLNPFQRRVALVAPGDPSARNATAREMGVHVVDIAIDKAMNRPGRYDPADPNAFPSGPYKGYVAKVNIDPVIEQINMIEASRAYEANVTSAEVTKQMMGMALRLIA